jgi:NAD(P)H-dependent nitrite reductase small subunit
MSAATDGWLRVCPIEAIERDTGVCALVDQRQIAIFRLEESFYALDNFDPASGANVLSRGLLGDLQGEIVVASPIYKHHYSLLTGRCLEDTTRSVNVYPVRVRAGAVWVQGRPLAAAPPRRRQLVVIGNGMAALRTLEQVLELAPQVYDITVFGAEPHGNYNRVLLPPLLAGDKEPEDLVLHPRSWYSKHGITLHASDPVVRIDRRNRRVLAASGREQPYDRLLIAVGARPNVLPVPGVQLTGVVTFRELADVELMLGHARRGARAVVIGGGLLGLEAADALVRRGLAVTVVHILDTLMERQLDAVAAGLLKSALEARGINFLMSARTTQLLGDTRVAAVRFADGTQVAADLVVMAVGIHPNIELAVRSGLRCERGILVDDTLQTWDPCVYAVGECVQHRDVTFGLVAPLMEQARVCATHLAELGVSRYRSAPAATSLRIEGVRVFAAGDPSAGRGCETLVLRDPRRGVYKRLILRNNRLQGAVLYGDIRHGPWYSDLLASGRDLSALREQLLFGPAAGD